MAWRTNCPSGPAARGERRFVFVGQEDALVFLKGDISHKDFWHFDLRTRRERQLTSLGRDFEIRDFDVSADGREIFFDRIREESDIVMFDLAAPAPLWRRALAALRGR